MNKKLLLICLSLMLLSGCASREMPIRTRQIFAMDTIIEINAYTDDEQILDQIEQRVVEIEKLMSRTIPNSEVSRINDLAGTDAVRVSEDTYAVLKAAEKYHQLSNDAFQITVLPLVELWNIGSDQPQVPDATRIDEVKQFCSSRYLELNEVEKTAYLTNSQAGIELGGIAKGYVADEVIKLLKEDGIEHALVSVGGGIQALGGKLDHQPWVIGLENPIDATRGYFATCEITDGAIVTSGDYQRFMIVDNERYHHLIDCKTGYPVDNGLASVTIWSSNSIDADALSTAVYVLGIEKGAELINSIEDTEALFVTHSKDLTITQGLKDRLNIVDKGFSINEIR